MGTVDSTLLFAAPNTNWVNATLWASSKWQVQPSLAECFVPSILTVYGEFPASRGVLSPYLP
jgi:hypothetical protein